MLNWAQQFSILLLLDSNEYQSQYSRYECVLAVNPVSIIEGTSADQLNKVYKWHQENKDWLFGHICYDYKNLLETKLSSHHEPKHNFPLLHFFCPQIVCTINQQKTLFTIESIGINPKEIFQSIQHTAPQSEQPGPKISFRQKLDQTCYLETIGRLRKHIKDGDCYEISFCSEGYAENVEVDPLQVFHELNKISPAPFASFYKLNEQYMMCASPERYLRKEGNTVLSQPIKGTARRDEDSIKDNFVKEQLRNSIKERAENVMIVDLVRNDLARSCEVGSVTVDELFGIYSFPQVHQMISTISGKLKANVPFTDALAFSFPMGSMTGAPKIKAMQLLEQYEQSRRELFSGTVGYISPDANFDFNVIIRSLFYNKTANCLSYQTGGAITYDSDPEQEWQEMRLKAWALERIFA